MTDPAARLNESELREALDLAGEIAACGSEAEMTAQLTRLPAIVGSDTVLIGEVGRAGGGAATLSATDDPPGSFDQESLAAFSRLWHQHPVVTRHFGAPAPGALKVSDFLSDRRWRRTEIFSDCYGGRLGIGWELSTQIRFSATTQACVALGRTDHDFGEPERAFLDLINPHLRAGFARLERESLRDRRLDLLERGIESRRAGVVLVDHGGAIVSARPRVRATLARWFEAGPEATGLPEVVDRWRRRHRGSADPPPLDRQIDDRRLRLSLVPGPGEDAILVAEYRDARPDPRLLAERLPLSRREAEVLALIAEGHINASIAIELGLSPNTVGRYIERVYIKLDVHNRAAATAAARDALED